METMPMFQNVSWAPVAGHVQYTPDMDWQHSMSPQLELESLGDQELHYDYTHVPGDQHPHSDYYDQVDMDYTEEHMDDTMTFEVDSDDYVSYDQQLHYPTTPPVEQEHYTPEQSQEYYDPSTIPTQGQWSTAYPTVADTSGVIDGVVPVGYHYDPEVAKLLENAKPAIPFGVQHYFPWSGRVVCRAHQPIPPSYQSRYSELTPHLDFMKKFEQGKAPNGSAGAGADQRPSQVNKSTQDPPGAIPITGPIPVAPTSGSSETTSTSTITTTTTSSTNTTTATATSPTTTKQTLNPGPRIRQAQRPILPSPARLKAKKSSSLVPPAAAAGTSRARAPRQTTALFIRTDPATGQMVGSRARETTKKPSLACKFCKERKIACGRPAEDAEDQTCNQCARRQIKCEYRPTDKKRSSAQAKY